MVVLVSLVGPVHSSSHTHAHTHSVAAHQKLPQWKVARLSCGVCGGVGESAAVSWWKASGCTQIYFRKNLDWLLR